MSPESPHVTWGFGMRRQLKSKCLDLHGHIAKLAKSVFRF